MLVPGDAEMGGAKAELARDPANADTGHRSGLLNSLVTGAGALGLALGIERGGSFFANVLAARLGGAQIFGAYSIALTAANNVAWYVGAGIGDTASRFIAEHQRGTPSYRTVIRCLLVIACVSAAVAAVLLLAGAEPMARLLLRNASLAGPLRVAALSSVAFVFLECCRGIFIGTRSFGRQLVLSTCVGIGLLAVVPQAAKLGASQMLARQSGAVLLAVLIAFILILRDRHTPQRTEVRETEAPRLGRVWKFGLMQLGGVAGMNAAGWWTASLVARWDVSLLQVAFYVVATQLRNVSSLVPSLVQHGNFAYFTDEGARHHGGADRVITVSSYVSSVLATICSGIAVIAIPWILSRFYGKDYVRAEFPAVLAVATLLVHFGVAPAASRLMIVSPFSAGVVNAIWAVFVVVTATLVIPSTGALGATATLFVAHVLSMFMVVATLWKLSALPAGVLMLAILDTATASLTGLLGWTRVLHPQYAVGIDFLVLGMTAAVSWYLLRLGQAKGIFPKTINLAALLRRGRGTSTVASLGEAQ
jgi:O-antigen/teichoic acid export membrane protein